MVKRKIYINQMEVGDLKPKGCFTDDSYVVIAIPSYKEKSRFLKESQNIDKSNDIENFDLLSTFVIETSCFPIDNDGEEIKDFDNAMAFADGTIIINWLTNMILHGFVPKKS